MAEEPEGMVGGATASRILIEVGKGITYSSDDTPTEASYRKEIHESMNTIIKQGGIVDAPKDIEFP